ncbi:hypothetical protein BBK82_04475 [Lentzea guizhouensis]|uniref:Uncharacterized protein n=1 Tax=Lentzea guizhouensis TaxID=1586287 RepID=A0A1B2HCK4_9PSEU|nr:hypothetical protein [Lentzea guizhouensis]ANZ35443.1 hypothetical protein BBK82_04475 [Lentzea guizhouensis]
MSDAQQLDEVIALLQTGPGVEEGLVIEVAFDQWDPDDHPDLDYDDLEELAKPRIDELRDAFVQRADDRWRSAEVPQDEDFPFGYHHGWRRGSLAVAIGAVVHDNGLPLMVLLRAQDVTS